MSAAVARLPVPAAAPTGALDLPVDIAVYEVCGGGKARRGTVNTPLADSLRGATWFGPGCRRSHAAAAVHYCEDTVARCAPWIRCYLGPVLWHLLPPGRDVGEYRMVRRQPDGSIAAVFVGQAWPRLGIVLVSVALVSYPDVRATLHHELWHAVESRLAAGDRAAVDSAVRCGVSVPSQYLDSATERRARLYESWTSAHAEGWRPISVSGWPIRRLDRIFWYVHSGGLARDIAARDAARPQNGPLEKMSRAILAGAREAFRWPLCLVWPVVVLLVLIR